MPFAESHDLPEFKEWLIRTLEPMCDADPAVMSDYIIALLKHDAVMSDEDWKQFISRELADFLEDSDYHSHPFGGAGLMIDSRPFVETLFQALQTKSFMPVAPAINPAVVPAPMAAAAAASIANAPSAPLSAAASSFRPTGAPPGAPLGPTGSASSPAVQNGAASENRDVEMGGLGSSQASGSGKAKCADYHERGFCMRGVDCPFEHDADVIIPTPDMMFAQMGMAMPFMSGPPQGNFRGGRGGRGRGGENGHRGGGRGRGGGPPGHGPGPGSQQQFPPPFFPFPMPNMPFASFIENDPRKDFWGSTRPPVERTNTLVVTNIPQPNLGVPSIREFFSQFGEVTNVAVEATSRRALVSFANNQEAMRAFKAPEAVFGSRHVKVLWHRPREGQGGAGQKALAKSANLINNLNRLEDGDSIQTSQARLSGPETKLRDTLAELEAREKRSKKETLVAEQKVLLARAQSSADKAEKVKLLGRLREIGKEMEELDKPKEEPVDVEMSDKDRLDAELEKHGMESTKGKDQEELLRLSAQLSALKEKASTLGIPSGSPRYSPYPGARGSRARGRGRGRGGYGSRPMSLDNRPRSIAVSGEALASEESRKSVTEWYESSGGTVSQGEKGLVVSYPSRDLAERALAQGTKDLPNGGEGISAAWHAQPQLVASSSTEVEMGDGGEGDDHTRRGDRDEEE